MSEGTRPVAVSHGGGAVVAYSSTTSQRSKISPRAKSTLKLALLLSPSPKFRQLVWPTRSPPNASVVTAPFVCALSAAGSIYLIVEMDQQFGGLIRFSNVPLVSVLEQFGRQYKKRSSAIAHCAPVHSLAVARRLRDGSALGGRPISRDQDTQNVNRER